jgi:hypothetical protein
MQASTPAIIGDPDLDARKPRELLDGRCLGRAGIRCGDQPKYRRLTALMPQDQAIDRVAEHAHAALRDEADEGIHAIGAVDLARELVADPRLAVPQGEQRGRGERCLRPTRTCGGIGEHTPQLAGG